MAVEYTSFDRPRRLASISRMPKPEIDGELVFEPEGTGTRMRWSWDVLGSDVGLAAGRPLGVVRAINKAQGALHSVGIWPNRLATLEVRGRRTGRLISFPVVIADYQGERYLVAMLGARADWVRNVQAAGGARGTAPWPPGTGAARTGSSRGAAPYRAAISPMCLRRRAHIPASGRARLRRVGVRRFARMEPAGPADPPREVRQARTRPLCVSCAMHASNATRWGHFAATRSFPRTRNELREVIADGCLHAQQQVAASIKRQDL